MAQQSLPAAVANIGTRLQDALTEEQLVCMTDIEYMNDPQTAFFRARLMHIEDMLRSRVRTAATEIASSSDVADPIDRASAEEEHQLALSNRTRDARQILEVGAALRRIEAGQFGWCVETGEPIGVDRLLICPTATLCFEAQQRRESKTRRYWV